MVKVSRWEESTTKTTKYNCKRISIKKKMTTKSMCTMCNSSITIIPISDRRPSSSNLLIKEFAFSIVQTATEVSLGSVPPP